jgi:DNA-binding CsgD family transcriptional regulator
MSVIVLSRGPGRDFTARDHDVLRLVRPHVDAAIHRLITPAPHLTRRESEVLLLVAEGLTDRQIGRRLHVSEATVGKHLEHVYARAGVRTRVQAAGLVDQCSVGLYGERRIGPSDPSA